jgi:hypothetical protein
MSFLIQPASGDLSPSVVFDEGCRESRIRELTDKIVNYILLQRELKAWALEHKKRFENIPTYPLQENYARLYEEAHKEAVRIVEQERKNVVEARTNYIKTTLNLAIRNLRGLTFTEKGKGKVYIEKKLVPSYSGCGYDERDILYFEKYPEGEQRFQQISQAISRVSEFRDYLPYFSGELTALWKEFSELESFEFIRVDGHEKTEETGKTEETEDKGKD